MAAAKDAAAKGPVRYTSPYDFMLSPSNGMTAIGPPWSEITAYDLNTGEIKWRVPHGGVTRATRAGHQAGLGVAHAAWWSTGHRRRSGVRGHRLGSHRARLRSRLGQGGVDQGSADRLRGRSGDVRSGRAPVHRVSRRRWRRVVPGEVRWSGACGSRRRSWCSSGRRRSRGAGRRSWAGRSRRGSGARGVYRLRAAHGTSPRGQPVRPSLPCQRRRWSKLVAVNARTGRVVLGSDRRGRTSAAPRGHRTSDGRWARIVRR